MGCVDFTEAENLFESGVNTCIDGEKDESAGWKYKSEIIHINIAVN